MSERTSHSSSSEPAIISELQAYVKGRGHPDFFCLDKNYSPGSRVPCVDFSPWLCCKIAAKDSEAVATFVWQVVQANPGMGLGVDYFENYWKSKAREILSVPLDIYLKQGTCEAYTELRCALILIFLHENLDGFVLTSEAGKYLATVMLPHRFKAEGVARLVLRANSFVRAMRKDAPVWKEFPLLTTEEFSVPEPPNDPRFADFQQRLGELPFGARLHFFDIIRYRAFRADSVRRTPLEGMTLYETRLRGLDPRESAQALVRSGLVIRVDDLESFLLNKTKDELSAILSGANVGHRESWKKDRLVRLALDRCQDKVSEMSREVMFGDVAPEYDQAARLGMLYVDSSALFYRLWLGFGLGLE